MIVLAIDPGKDKTGMAVVDKNLQVYDKTIVNTKDIKTYLNNIFCNYDIKLIVLGNGTTSEKMKSRLDRFLKTETPIEIEIPIVMVDESNSTIAAERRYRQEHSPQGWKQFLKFVTWKPEVAVDDYVAVILAERYFFNKGDM